MIRAFPIEKMAVKKNKSVKSMRPILCGNRNAIISSSCSPTYPRCGLSCALNLRRHSRCSLFPFCDRISRRRLNAMQCYAFAYRSSCDLAAFVWSVTWQRSLICDWNWFQMRVHLLLLFCFCRLLRALRYYSCQVLSTFFSF